MSIVVLDFLVTHKENPQGNYFGTLNKYQEKKK